MKSKRWTGGHILEGFEQEVKEVIFYSGQHLKDFKYRVRFTLK